MFSASFLPSLNSSSAPCSIDQLDKADPPVIPGAYTFLLVHQCLVSLSEGFANSVLPRYSSMVLQRQRHLGDNVTRAPPALDLSTLPAEATTKVLLTSRDMIETAWPALLAALSFLIGTNLSDELFADLLNSFQALTNVAGALNLTTPLLRLSPSPPIPGQFHPSDQSNPLPIHPVPIAPASRHDSTFLRLAPVHASYPACLPLHHMPDSLPIVPSVSVPLL